MARGGRRGTYVRDANGRFASSPGGSLGAARKAARPTSGRKGTLQARSSLKASRAKLAAKDRADSTLQNTLSTRAQKGAVTRASKKLAAAQATSKRTAVGRSTTGMISKKRSPAMKTKVLKQDKKNPNTNRPGLATDTLRRTMKEFAAAEAQRNRNIKAVTAQIDRPGLATDILRKTMKQFAAAEAQRNRNIKAVTSQKVTAPRKAPRKAPAGQKATVK